MKPPAVPETTVKVRPFVQRLFLGWQNACAKWLGLIDALRCCVSSGSSETHAQGGLALVVIYLFCWLQGLCHPAKDCIQDQTTVIRCGGIGKTDLNRLRIVISFQYSISMIQWDLKSGLVASNFGSTQQMRKHLMCDFDWVARFLNK